MARSGCGSGPSREDMLRRLIVIRNQADAEYVKRLQILRAAAGSLHLTGGTTALFAERADCIPFDLSPDEPPETPLPLRSSPAASRTRRKKGPADKGRTRGE